MNSLGKISGYEGCSFDRIVQCAYNLEDAEQFVKGGPRKIPMSGCDEMLANDPLKRNGIGTKLGRAQRIEQRRSIHS